MNTQLSPAQKAARDVEHIQSIDPGLGAYSFGNLGEVVQFGELMSRAGEMLPDHLRGKPALCMAVTMRAVQWGFDPFALAMETYQAKSGGPIGYQAKVFAAALRNCAGVQLQYDYEGEIEIIDKPVTSANGRQIAARTAKGNRKATAWAMVNGQRLTYETPKLDEITIKNSPLWHNDPDQQLAYYAARGWARRHMPDVMMGAFSKDEVEEMPSIRDVTPKAEAGGFRSLALKARQGAEADPDPNPTDEADKPAHEASSGPTDPPEDDTPDETDGEIMPEDDIYLDGVTAAQLGHPRSSCPKDLAPGEADRWFAGFDSVREAEE